MLYAIHYMNHLKASHHLALLETEEEAKKFYNFLEKLWNGEGCENLTDNDFDFAYSAAFEEVVAEIEDINSNHIEEKMKNVTFSRNIEGRVSTYTDDIKVVNYGSYTYTPC